MAAMEPDEADPLRRLLTDAIDFAKLRESSPVELLIAATEVASGKMPRKMRNSPTKPLRPGRPSEEKRAMPIMPQKTGATLRRPPKSLMPRSPPERSSSSARNQKIAAAVRPWLNICSTTPSSAAVWLRPVPALDPTGSATAKIANRQ